MCQMMSLGGFLFSLSEGSPYEGLQRASDGGWVAVACYGQKPMSQNSGLLVVEGILTLNDTFPPEMKGNWSIDKVTA